MSTYVSVEVDVCIEEHLSQVDSKVLIEELTSRDYELARIKTKKSGIVNRIEYELVSGNDEKFNEYAKQYFYAMYGILGRQQ